jgi:S1-C subfamily serine protease
MICGLRQIAISLSVLFIIACAPERPKPEVIDFTGLCQTGDSATVGQSIFKSSIESTVRIYLIKRNQDFFNELTEGYGTGVIIDSKAGLILTAAHVVRGAEVIEATTRRVNSQFCPWITNTTPLF